MECFNGGTWNGTLCLCPTGYSGKQCQDKAIFCQNGGTWDGIKCICTSIFYGPTCEMVVENIPIEPPPEKVNATMEVKVSVTSMEYTQDLENSSSEAYMNFTQLFEKQMAIVYKNIPQYVGVKIKSLSNGSIVVDHEVILSTDFTPDFQLELKNITKIVQDTIVKVTQEQTGTDCNDVICFNPQKTTVKEPVLHYDPLKQCQSNVAEEFKDYFYIDYKDQIPHCINRCTMGFESSLNCNQGTCQFGVKKPHLGPRCLCFITDTHWYQGETCNFSISKNLVYGLAGALGIVLSIGIGILSVFLHRSWRKTQRQKTKLDQVYKWHEEDGGPAPGSFQNIGFDICEEQEDSLNMDSIYSNFQPSLGHIDPEKKIQIQRPQVVMTSV